MSHVAEAPPVGGFSSFPLGPAVMRGVAALGFTSPRPIQQAAIPAAVAGPG